MSSASFWYLEFDQKQKKHTYTKKPKVIKKSMLMIFYQKFNIFIIYFNNGIDLLFNS